MLEYIYFAYSKYGTLSGFVLCPSPSSLGDILSVRGPPPSLKRTYLKKSLCPAFFPVRRPPPSQDGRPRPATPDQNNAIKKSDRISLLNSLLSFCELDLFQSVGAI